MEVCMNKSRLAACYFSTNTKNKTYHRCWEVNRVKQIANNTKAIHISAISVVRHTLRSCQRHLVKSASNWGWLMKMRFIHSTTRHLLLLAKLRKFLVFLPSKKKICYACLQIFFKLQIYQFHLCFWEVMEGSCSSNIPLWSNPQRGCGWDASPRHVMLHVISLVKLHCQWVSSRGHMRLSVDCNM